MVSVDAARRAEKISEGVRKWQKTAVQKRCSQKKLAEKLGTTVSKLRPFLKSPCRQLRKAGERRMVLEKVASARSAAQIYREVQPKSLAERSVRRLREPTRREIRATKKRLKLENRVTPEEHAQYSQSKKAGVFFRVSNILP